MMFIDEELDDLEAEHQAASDLFEKQKEAAMATMKKSEELKLLGETGHVWTHMWTHVWTCQLTQKTQNETQKRCVDVYQLSDATAEC